MSRNLMPKSGAMAPYVVMNRDAAVAGVFSVDGEKGAVNLTSKYLQIVSYNQDKVDNEATLQTINDSIGNLNTAVGGKAAKGANSDITELNALTKAIAIAQGGTGAKSAFDARKNLELGPENGVAFGPSLSLTSVSDVATIAGAAIFSYLKGTNGKLRSTARLRSEVVSGTSRLVLTTINYNSNGEDIGQGHFILNVDGSVELGKPLEVKYGGTGANSAEGAKNSLGLDRFMQYTNAGETQMKCADLTKQIFIKDSGSWGCWDNTNNKAVALPIGYGGTGGLTAAEARANLDVYSKDESVQAVGAGWPLNAPDNMNVPVAAQTKGFMRMLPNITGGPGPMGGSGWVSQYSGDPAFAGMFVQPDGNRVFAGGRQPSQNNGNWQWHEVPTLDRSNRFNVAQTVYNRVIVERETWPGVEFQSTSKPASTVGYRVQFEISDELIPMLWWRQKDTNTGQLVVTFPKPGSGSMPVSYAGGLAPTGHSFEDQRGSTDFNVGPQGWRGVGGVWSNAPVAGNVYGSLFTQATQGLNAGNYAANGVLNQWYQQRFYDTSNRIFTRVQTNAQAWQPWHQITTSAVSDIRTKDVNGELDVEVSLDNVGRMEFKNFTFLTDKGEKPRRGVISQQIMEIDPQYVREIGDLYHLDQTPMLLDGLAAIKALKLRDESKDAKIAALEKDVAELKKLVQQLLNK